MTAQNKKIKKKTFKTKKNKKKIKLAEKSNDK